MKEQQLFENISADLAKVEAGLLRVVLPKERTLTGIGTQLLQAGGKRLRPALCLLTAKIATYNLDRLLPVAIALELIHMASLIHDDVIDEACIRRGSKTANAKSGNLMAVLAGDFLFAQAFASIAPLSDSRIINTLSQLVSSMCEGEIIQFMHVYDVSQTEEDYLIRIQKKTADFLGCACELGSYMAQADAKLVENMQEYGFCIGMAFQITDDILDIIADDQQIGKPAGNDLRQGIITLPIIYALANSPEREELRSIIEKKQLMTSDDVSRGLTIIRTTDAVEYAYGLADQYIERAKERLTVIEDRIMRDRFACLADFIGQRNY